MGARTRTNIGKYGNILLSIGKGVPYGRARVGLDAKLDFLCDSSDAPLLTL